MPILIIGYLFCRILISNLFLTKINIKININNSLKYQKTTYLEKIIKTFEYELFKTMGTKLTSYYWNRISFML